MNVSSININVHTDENKIPDAITWNATDTTADNDQKAKAMMLSFWDGAEKTALRIDLWTKDMPVDEMKRFFYETLQTMGDSFLKATGEKLIIEDLRDYCAHFADKMGINTKG